MSDIRRSDRKLSPLDIKRLKALALKIDREEGDELKAKASAYKREADRLREIFRQLQAERQRQNLSLSEVARRSGIDKGRLSRLESEEYPNVTIDTLERYAQALHKRIVVALVDAN